MSHHIFLVDGNSIAHANHNATELSVGGFQVQAIFGFLKSLRAMLQRTPGRPEVIVLWDGSAEFRKAIYPDYKGNRKPLDAKQAAHKEAFKRQMPLLEKALEALGIKQIRSPLLEADDLAHFFVERFAGKQITLVSGDKDWIQLVRDNVTWFDPIRDRKVDHFDFLDKTGYATPHAFVQGKALQGDNSDNIDGVYKLGEKTAQLMLAEFGSIGSFFDRVNNGSYEPKKRGKNAASLHPEQLLAAPEGRQLFARNMLLMDLSRARKPEPGELIIKMPPAEPEKFIAICERLNFASILRDRHAFLRDFNLSLAEQAAA